MSKKDYEAIAAALRAAFGDLAPNQVVPERDRLLLISQRNSVVDGLADVFKADNPAFNRKRFMDACENWEV